MDKSPMLIDISTYTFKAKSAITIDLISLRGRFCIEEAKKTNYRRLNVITAIKLSTALFKNLIITNRQDFCKYKELKV